MGDDSLAPSVTMAHDDDEWRPTVGELSKKPNVDRLWLSLSCRGVRLISTCGELSVEVCGEEFNSISTLLASNELLLESIESMRGRALVELLFLLLSSDLTHELGYFSTKSANPPVRKETEAAYLCVSLRSRMTAKSFS